MFGRFLFDKNSTCMIVSNQKININMMRLLDYARSDRKDGIAVLDFFTRMRPLHFGRGDIKYDLYLIKI